MDCGGRFHYCVMDADHRDPDIRLFSLSRANANISISEFFSELDKCDIICANCHRLRTFKNGGFFPKRQRKGAVLAGSEQPSY